LLPDRFRRNGERIYIEWHFVYWRAVAHGNEPTISINGGPRRWAESKGQQEWAGLRIANRAYYEALYPSSKFTRHLSCTEEISAQTTCSDRRTVESVQNACLSCVVENHLTLPCSVYYVCDLWRISLIESDLNCRWGLCEAAREIFFMVSAQVILPAKI
jgi:hypothetical protein